MLNQSWKTVLASAVIIGGCCFSAPSYAGGLFSGSGNLLTDQLAKLSCCGESACGDESSCSLSECGEGCCTTGAGGITFGGWTQVGYHNGEDGVFNDESGNINLHQGWLYAERVADGRNGLDFGFRADVMYGIDADDTDSDGNNPGNWDYRNGFDHGPYGFALPQLYVEMASGDLSVKAGHFFSIMGYERVTSPDNFFYSRSKSLDWIEPRTHTGALGTYAVSCDTNVYAGWTLGWDTGFDQREGGSNFLGGFSTAVTDNATFTYVTTAGDMGREGEGYGHMLLLDIAVTCKLNYVIQSDFQDMEESDGDIDNDVAITQYLFYDVNDTFSVGGRFEWIDDDGASQFQTTLGVNVRPTDNIVIRPEVRFQPDTNVDGRDDAVFGVDAILVF
ncbi:MAG: porin [Fuerstiella sp.]|nr:porin [Fuerstiella sp.]